MHVNKYVDGAVNAPVDCDPLKLFDPLQPSDALQAVAFMAFHVSVDELPFATLVGLAVNVIVGSGRIVTATD